MTSNVKVSVIWVAGAPGDGAMALTTLCSAARRARRCHADTAISGRPPGAVLEGVWLQDNGFGCLRLRLSGAGKGVGIWGVWTGQLDSPVLVRLTQTAAAQSPTPAPRWPSAQIGYLRAVVDGDS